MKTIHTCPAGTAAIYKPECLSDCNDINCTACVFDTFRGRGDNCPFRRYITTYPVKEPVKSRPVTRQVDYKCDSIDTKEPPYVFINTILGGKLHLVRQSKGMDLTDTDTPPLTTQEIIDLSTQLQANALQQQIEPLQDMVNVLDLIIEVTEKQDKLTKTQQEQPAQEDQSNIPLWFMPSMENANDDVDGRDHYHHCPQKDNKLVRLIYVEEDKVHACPTCRRVFYLK